jgi:cation-transporting ATPase 13A2
MLTATREGRAALVTSFSCFKYMSLYSAIQFTSVSFLYAKASNLGDFQFLFIDVLLILPIAIFMGWAGPAPVLSRKRPTANLVSRKVLTPLLGLMTICVAIQAIAYVTVREQPWYIPPKVKHEESNIKNSENTALFLTSCFEYILSGIILNAGAPFRQGLAQNYPFCFTILASLVITLSMVLVPGHQVKKTMQLTKMALDYKFFLISLGLAYFVLAWGYELYIGMRLARVLGHVKQRLTGKAKKRKAYKIIKESMLT